MINEAVEAVPAAEAPGPVGDGDAPNPPPAPVEMDLPRAGLIIGQNCPGSHFTIHNIYMGRQ